MNQEEFKAYQRQLNAERENKLKHTPKLSPKVLLTDADFDISLNNIPFNIKPPVLPISVPQVKEHKNPKSSPLF